MLFLLELLMMRNYSKLVGHKCFSDLFYRQWWGKTRLFFNIDTRYLPLSLE